MATYNGERFLEEQLSSLLNQTYHNWVCYIHDDGSTDNTLIIIKKYTDAYPKKFIKLNYDKTGGARNNFLSLLKYVNNNISDDFQYCMFSDQDDVWKNNKIEITLDCLKRTDDNIPIAVFTDLLVVDQKLNIIADSFMKYSKHDPHKTKMRDIFVANPAPGCTMMLNKKLCSMAAQYVDPENIEMHDWWCMAIAAVFGKVAYLSESTIYYRQHGDNTLGAINRHSIKYYINIIKMILSGKQGMETKKRIHARRRMANELVTCFGYEKTGFVNELAIIQNQNKFSRMRFYNKNRLYNSFNHKIWILMCC